MPAATKAAKTIYKAVSDDKKKKEGGMKNFMTGLKNWITSPGGIATLILIAGVVWYVNHKTKDS